MMIIRKCQNMQIWKHTNTKVEKCKKYVKKVNLFIKNCKVASNRNDNKDTNKPDKGKNIKAVNL